MNNLLKIKKIGHLLKIIFIAFLFLIPLIYILYWLFFNYLPYFLKSECGIENNINLSLHNRLLALLVNSIQIINDEIFILILIKLFSLYESGYIFTRKNVKYYKIIGLLILLQPFIRVITATLESLVLSINKFFHGYFFVIACENIGDIIIGSIILLIAWIMDEGRKMDEEQQYTI